MDRLRQAMNEYLRQLPQPALQTPQAQQQQQPGRELSRQDLERMLDEMQERAESGMRDQAQAMLDQLSQMLQNLRPGQQQAGQSDGEQALQQLQDMIQRHRLPFPFTPALILECLGQTVKPLGTRAVTAN